MKIDRGEVGIMGKSASLVGIYAMLLTVGAIAQTTVTTAGGATNSVPKFSGSGTIVNSAITEANGNVGIGTPSPLHKLDLMGGFIDVETNSGQYTSSQIDGISSPITTVGLGALFAGDLILRSYWGVSVDLNNGNYGDSGAAPYTRIPDTSSFTINSRTSSTAFQTLLTVRNSGNTGIGTTTPGAKLEVNGNVKLTNGSGASITFADNTVQSTAWTGTLCGGDYAESVDVSGDHSKYEPGDVLVLSDDSGSDVSKSSHPYSTMVGGIYATKPGLVGRRQKGEKSDAEIPMAMVGIVPTKVSAENGPIRRGDLLVTSSTVGHAMKGTDPSRMLGAIVGKALGSLDSGAGVIEVLVSLQ